jgi:Protein of unknown function (DUF1329)
MLVFVLLAPGCLLAQEGSVPSANQTDASRASSAQPDSAIPPGTSITMQNWQNYKQFMPDGMVALFEGKYFWKMPADVSMEVGPKVNYPLPRNYIETTQKYASQVKIVELSDGGATLTGYHGGVPFPNPDEPHKGRKVLPNLWYRYMPRLVADTDGYTCGVNAMGGANCISYEFVLRQFAFNTDPGTQPATDNNGIFFTNWFMLLKPEQQKDTTTLTIEYADPTRTEDSYVFLPALRRHQALSSLARCSETAGTDANHDDYQFGFDSNITQLKVDYVAKRKFLTLAEINLPRENFPAGFDLPLGWPQASMGKWQVRDVDEISVSKLPSRGGASCYGKRVLYVDSHFYTPLWVETLDQQMQPQRLHAIFPRTVDAPGIGPVNANGSDVEMFWDVAQNHVTFTVEPAAGGKHYINEQAPQEYDDVSRYSTPSGLNLIMR